MINSVFGSDEYNLHPPLNRSELINALKMFDRVDTVSTVRRAIAWCHYCDLRDKVPAGTSAQKFVNGTMLVTGFLSSCHMLGWTNVKYKGETAESDQRSLQTLDEIAKERRARRTLQ